VSKFGEVLREYISKNGYSINEFAGKCKIDRAWLSNVLSGRKELSEAKFDNILKSKLLSESQNENLIALYRLKDFSSDQVERMEYIIEHLSRKIRRNDSIAPIKYDENRRMYLGKANLLSVLYRIIENKDELSFIYTNIPTEAEESLDVLYDFLKHDDYKKIDYKHIFLTDNGVSIHNISTYFTICDFAELGYTDFSVIKDVELSSLNTNDFFPYFILTDKKIMLFDAEFNNAIVSFDDKIINVHTRKFMALYEKGENPVTSFSNAVDLMRTLTSMHDSSSELSFTPDFCVTPCLDYDILNKNAAPNLPDKELLIRAVLNHYNIDYSHFSNFVTIESINRFAKDGIIYEIPRDYLLPVDVESRIKLLKSVKDNIDKWYKLIEDNKNERVSYIHNNINLDHYLKSDKPYLISWNKSRVDSPIYDLLSFYKNHYLEFDFDDLFHYYESNYPLKDNERLLLFIYMAIPPKIVIDGSEYDMCIKINKNMEYLYKTSNLIMNYQK